MDQDGYITLTDRLSRFSKMCGEMAPHGAVENALLNSEQMNEPILAVTTVADPLRGEKLVVFYTEET